MAWEISNELEYWRFSGSQVRAWIEDISGYIKTLDKRHLLTIGISTNNLETVNNEELFKMFAAPALDFFSFHFYPQPGETPSNKDGRFENGQKINALTKKFLRLGKPAVMAELGLSNSIRWNEKVRDNSQSAGLYAVILKEYTDEAFNAGCSGVMFWGWGIPEASGVPMWWSKEDHSTANDKFCDFLKNYHIPAAR